MATEIQLKEFIRNINKNLIRDDIKIILGRRYGHYALDIRYKDRNCISTLVAGCTKNEILEYLNAMCKGAEYIKNELNSRR